MPSPKDNMVDDAEGYPNYEQYKGPLGSITTDHTK